MPFIQNELAANARGGTEMMVRGLEQRLIEAGHQDLLDAVDIYPSRIRDFNPDRPSIFWAHDLPGDPESDHLLQDGGSRFAAMVFVSHWQYQQYQRHYGLSMENALVIPNAISPVILDKLLKWDVPGIGTEANPIRLIYHTTPHRGLQILVPVFEYLYDHWKSQGIHVELDVFSSFSIYGWEQRDEPYQELFERCKAHPAIRYHGARPNEEVREALKKAHIFAYPSIWQETSCIAMIEALSAYCIAVHSNLAALPETTGGLTCSYSFTDNVNAHANLFAASLDEAVRMIYTEPYGMQYNIHLAAARVHLINDWHAVTDRWASLLRFVKSRVASSV